MYTILVSVFVFCTAELQWSSVSAYIHIHLLFLPPLPSHNITEFFVLPSASYEPYIQYVHFTQCQRTVYLPSLLVVGLCVSLLSERSGNIQLELLEWFPCKPSYATSAEMMVRHGDHCLQYDACLNSGSACLWAKYSEILVFIWPTEVMRNVIAIWAPTVGRNQ